MKKLSSLLILLHFFLFFDFFIVWKKLSDFGEVEVLLWVQLGSLFLDFPYLFCLNMIPMQNIRTLTILNSFKNIFWQKRRFSFLASVREVWVRSAEKWEQVKINKKNSQPYASRHTERKLMQSFFACRKTMKRRKKCSFRIKCNSFNFLVRIALIERPAQNT